MKKLTLLIISIISYTALSATAAIFDSDKGNGGDSCERKMLNIANDFKLWLSTDSHLGILLPAKITQAEYKEKMLDAITNSTLNCTTNKLYIGNVEKTCKNLKESNDKKTIICNFQRFNYTEDSEKYKLLHHEFAGISGFETNINNENSNYTITNQINQFLSIEMQMKLNVKNEHNQWKSKILICNEEQSKSSIQIIINLENQVSNVSLISHYTDFQNNPYIINFKKKKQNFIGTFGECSNQATGGQTYLFNFENGIANLDVKWCNDDGEFGHYNTNLNCFPVN